MCKMFLSAVLACVCCLSTVDAAKACHGGWGGCGYGGWGWGGWGGCGYGGYYSGGYYGGDYYCGSYATSNYYGGAYLAAAPAQASATLVVHLPADAVLTIDGKPTTSTSAQRSSSAHPL